MLTAGRCYELSDILAAEIEAINGRPLSDEHGAPRSLAAELKVIGDAARNQEIPSGRSADEAAELARRSVIYDLARRLNLSALCLSGGGIRSASVSLGVIQALADKNLLREFNYLSTVSGGGYIGSWLSAWLYHSRDADKVIDQLRQRRVDADAEPPPIDHLRRYSNYLTPKLGIFSEDTWTAVAIVLRNLLVNWLILIPALALPVLGVKFVAAALTPMPGAAYPKNELLPLMPLILAICPVVLGWIGLGYKLHRLYAPPATRDTQLSQGRFIVFSLIPAVLAGFCFVWLLMRGLTPADALIGHWLQLDQGHRALWSIVLFAFVVFAGAVGMAFIDRSLSTSLRPRRSLERPDPKWYHAEAFRRFLNLLAWLAGVFVFALLVWAGVRLAGDMDTPVTVVRGLCVPVSPDCVTPVVKQAVDLQVDRTLFVVILGMPWFLVATMSAHSVYLLLRSASGNGDVEREWLGRASGWHFIAGFSWILLSTVVVIGPKLFTLGDAAGPLMSMLTAASGTVTAFLGKSGLTPAQGSAKGLAAVSANVVLAIVGSLFAVLLLVLLSVAADAVFTDARHIVPVEGTRGDLLCWFCFALAIIAFLALIDGFANVNRFSIHAIYRNRLVRAYLGGARAPNRIPDGFTDFDWDDNVRMAALWDDDRPVNKGRNWRPFHVVNMTLNLAATRNLAWQERKACSFTVTPQSCGSADLGYRPTQTYSGPVGGVDAGHEDDKTGITLGTAMAISGAAVSPNMGYHSSPALSFLLTLFNVRLGWWLGNPGRHGDKKPWYAPFGRPPYEREGPLFALRPLFAELLGMTSDESAYVYLSDGGHFEDLGLYEMVRRRCRWIIVCDDDQDGKRGFADLGNAVRKIWIDLGIRITFADAPLLQAGDDAAPADIPYFAIGTIEYSSDADPALPSGKLLYIKPTVRGDEDAADVIAYKRANPDFPAQTTGDQWFDESQLEAYRRLGYLMTYRMIGLAVGDIGAPTLEQLFARLADLDPKTMRPRGGTTGEGSVMT